VVATGKGPTVGGVTPGREFTFLFTDVEGSTASWEREPEAMRAALLIHDALLSQAIDDVGGTIVKHTGDGFLAVFPEAAGACSASVTAQRALDDMEWPTATPIRVRMGLHSGEAFEREGDYFGTNVNRCARLMGIAHGGQLVTSQRTWGLIAPFAPAEITGRPLGRHRLKGLAEPEDVVQIVAPGLNSDFPPLTSSVTAASNLVASRTTFVGRDEEMDRLEHALTAAQLVTLVGPGGVGKSRLAVEIARRVLPQFVDGAFVVDVASLTVIERITDRIGEVLRVPGEGRAVTWDMTLAYLSTRELVLVLNDCEHVIDSVAQIVDGILDTAYGVKLVVTSREPLNVDGEQVVSVEPLAAAPALFRDRARAAGATLPASDDTQRVIQDLCTAVDNLPLAVELLASHARSLSPAQMLEDLDRSLRAERRGRGARWSSLDETIAWSYSLLDDPLRVALRALSVIPGSFSRACGQEMMGSDAHADRRSALAQLVDKSLIVSAPDVSEAGEHRYRMLQTIRDHVSARLSEEEAATYRRQLRDWALARSTPASAVVRVNNTAHALDLERDIEVLRGCLESAAVEARQTLVPLAVAMSGIWWMLNRGDEGLRWFAETDNDPVDEDSRLDLLLGRAAAFIASDRIVELIPVLIEGAALARGPQHHHACAPMVLAFYGVAHLANWKEGLHVMEEARAADVGGVWAPFIDHFEADLYLGGDHFDEAVRGYGRALEGYSGRGYTWWEVAATACQAVALHLADDDEGALEVGSRALAMAGRNPDLFSASSRATVVAVPLAALGQLSRAVDAMNDVLDACAERRHVSGIAGEPLVGVAAVASIAGLDDQCSMLLGLARQSHQHVRSPWQYALYRSYLLRSGTPMEEAALPVADDPIDVARRVLDAVRTRGSVTG
jgi:predicted ATPase/class 3 adenylate cyclase